MAQIWMVPLKIVLNFSRFYPPLNWNRFFADLSRGSNSLNSDTKQQIWHINFTLGVLKLAPMAIRARSQSLRWGGGSFFGNFNLCLEILKFWLFLEIITTFFKSPYSDQSTTVQTRQSVFVQLLGAAFRKPI